MKDYQSGLMVNVSGHLVGHYLLAFQRAPFLLLDRKTKATHSHHNILVETAFQV
jgi:hypothetical protein